MEFLSFSLFLQVGYFTLEISWGGGLSSLSPQVRPWYMKFCNDSWGLAVPYAIAYKNYSLILQCLSSSCLLKRDAWLNTFLYTLYDSRALIESVLAAPYSDVQMTDIIFIFLVLSFKWFSFFKSLRTAYNTYLLITFKKVQYISMWIFCINCMWWNASFV